MGPELDPHGGDGPDLPRDGSAGFTLIELVVVVAVLSVLAVGAGLVASGSERSAAQSDVQRFQRLVEVTRARAIQARQVQGLFVTTRGFQAGVETADGWEKPRHETRWRGSVSLQVKTRRRTQDQPPIVLLPDGRISAFTLIFTPDNSTRIVCRSDGSAGVSCG
jgi:type II secretion system protein H